MGQRLVGADDPAELAALTGVLHGHGECPLGQPQRVRRENRLGQRGQPVAGRLLERVPADQLARIADGPDRGDPGAIQRHLPAHRRQDVAAQHSPGVDRQPMRRAERVERDDGLVGSGEAGEVCRQQDAVARLAVGQRRCRRRRPRATRERGRPGRGRAPGRAPRPAARPPARWRPRPRCPAAARDAQQARTRQRIPRRGRLLRGGRKVAYPGNGMLGAEPGSSGRDQLLLAAQTNVHSPNLSSLCSAARRRSAWRKDCPNPRTSVRARCRPARTKARPFS